MAAACPDCGQIARLPSLAPELLYFLSHGKRAPQRAVCVADSGYVAFAFDGRVHVMRETDWPHYEAMRDAA